MSVCEVCGRSDGDRLVWSVKSEVEPSSPVHVWRLCNYRHHALCVRCLREVEDAVELDEEGNAACAAMMVAESMARSACQKAADPNLHPDANVVLATLDYRETRVMAYAHHRKAMVRLRAQHEAARAKEPEA